MREEERESRRKGYKKKCINYSSPLTSIWGGIKNVGGTREEKKDTRRNA